MRDSVDFEAPFVGEKEKSPNPENIITSPHREERIKRERRICFT